MASVAAVAAAGRVSEILGIRCDHRAVYTT
jgi:hypothetical protein